MHVVITALTQDRTWEEITDWKCSDKYWDRMYIISAQHIAQKPSADVWNPVVKI